MGDWIYLVISERKNLKLPRRRSVRGSSLQKAIHESVSQESSGCLRLLQFRSSPQRMQSRLPMNTVRV